MKKRFLITVLLPTLCLLCDNINSQNLLWAKQMGGVNKDVGTAIVTDVNGNVYTAGYFEGMVDFDPGTGTHNLTSSAQDIFISKLDVSGNLVWVKRLGGTGGDNALSIAIDDNGNVYTTGYFQGTVDFDPNAGISNLTSVGNNDIFVCKLDAFGNFLWAKRFGGINVYASAAHSITVDASENVYTTGYFANTVDFDPGIGIYNLTSTGLGDIFISKLNAAGNLVWAKRMGGKSDDYGKSISIDDNGNVYVTGYFRDTANFDPGTGKYNLTSAGLGDIFVSKLNASGNFVWAKQIGGAGDDGGNSIVIDSSGNVYTTGFFYLIADFDPSSAIYNLTSVGVADIFVSKLDAFGNFLWAKQMGGTSHDRGISSEVDVKGNLCTTGYFSDTGDFDPSSGTYNLISAGGADIFISKLDASGNFLSANRLGGLSGDWGYSVAVDVSGNIYSTGYFVDSVDFDPGNGVYSLISNGSQDVFVVKMDSAIVSGIGEQRNVLNSVNIYPNPSDSQFIISCLLKDKGEFKVKIYNVQGGLVTTLAESVLDAGTYNLQWDSERVDVGIYFVQVTTERNSFTKKLIVCR